MRTDRNGSHQSAKSVENGRRRRHDARITTQKYTYSDEQKLGIVSTSFLIVNKMLGSAIFSTPAIVFSATGSVGISLILWLCGGIFAFCGLSIYLEFGLAIPRSGGEKNYLERIFRKPKYLTTCILAAQMTLLGFSSGEAIAFGQLIVNARSSRVASESWAARAIGIACVTLAVIIHSLLPKWGIRLMNLMGIFKVVVMLVIAFSGVAALAGYRATDDPHNFEHSFSKADMARYGSGSFWAYSNAIFSIIYTFSGWESANYVLSEVRNPKRTLAIAAPLAVGTVTVLYMLANIAYFAAVRKLDLAKSERLIAALFFQNMFGEAAAVRTLPVFVAISSLGSVLATSFVCSRLSQELAKEAILPFPRFWASNRPCNAPTASLCLHWLVTVIVMIAPPLGQSYDLIIELSVYPRACIHAILTAGLIYLQWSKSERWKSRWHTLLPFSIAFLLLNGFLLVAPFIPPPGYTADDWDLHYMFPITGLAVIISGILYWLIWSKLLPRLRGYRVETERVFGHGGELVLHRRVSYDE